MTDTPEWIKQAAREIVTSQALHSFCSCDVCETFTRQIIGCHVPPDSQLKTLASAMRKVLPSELLKEVLSYCDPLGEFMKFLQAPDSDTIESK